MVADTSLERCAVPALLALNTFLLAAYGAFGAWGEFDQPTGPEGPPATLPPRAWPATQTGALFAGGGERWEHVRAAFESGYAGGHDTLEQAAAVRRFQALTLLREGQEQNPLLPRWLPPEWAPRVPTPLVLAAAQAPLYTFGLSRGQPERELLAFDLPALLRLAQEHHAAEQVPCAPVWVRPRSAPKRAPRRCPGTP